MYQYASKSQTQCGKAKANALVNNKNNVQTGTKMPVQTKSLFSPSFKAEKSEEQEQLKPTSIGPNNTGIPTPMKSHFEALSGFSFDDVKVHYNSDKPAQLQALAYAQGNQVYVGPGQEKHLGHELGHVVQQKQGIVRPTHRIQGVAVNVSPHLESYADEIAVSGLKNQVSQLHPNMTSLPIIQCCYMCGQANCNYGETCGGATVANTIMTRHANSLARTFASARASVLLNTPYTAASFKVDGQDLSFAEDHPTLARYNFHGGVIAAAKANHPTYNDGTGDLYPCPYCGWDYPQEAMHIDHIVPWADYAKSLANQNDITDCTAWQVYVACNDTLNLTLACAHCNESKSDQTLTQGWVDNIRALALPTGGFDW